MTILFVLVWLMFSIPFGFAWLIAFALCLLLDIASIDRIKRKRAHGLL